MSNHTMDQMEVSLDIMPLNETNATILVNSSSHFCKWILYEEIANSRSETINMFDIIAQDIRYLMPLSLILWSIKPSQSDI